MGRQKKNVETPEAVHVKVVKTPGTEVITINPVFARQKHLLDLIAAMKNEGAQDVGYLEVLLSRVNQQIAEL